MKQILVACIITACIFPIASHAQDQKRQNQPIKESASQADKVHSKEIKKQQLKQPVKVITVTDSTTRKNQKTVTRKKI